MIEAIRGGVAVVSVFGSVMVFCVFFLLTDPQAIDKFSDETRATIGLISWIVLGWLGFSEIKSVFFDRRQNR
jgi:hypothetical protein